MVSVFFGAAFLLTCAVSFGFLSIWLSRISGEGWPRFLEGRRAKVEEAAELSGVRLTPALSLSFSAAWPVARIALRKIRKRRLVCADRQMPGALSLICNALKAGLGLTQAIEMASLELGSPLGNEFRRISAELKLGRTVEEAMVTLEERLPTEDISLFVQSVAVLRRTGGNLVETFSMLAQTVEARLRVEERIRVITSQGVVQGFVLLAMPWLLAVALWFVSPRYLGPLVSTRAGLAMVAFGIILECAGAIWLRKLVLIKV